MIEAEPLILRCRWRELALRRHGFDGTRLQRLANRVANDYLRARGGRLDPYRFGDLRDFLVERALNAVMRYDPERQQSSYGSNGGDPVASYLADIMEKGCTDWYRSKSEGNGDRRYANDNRVVLSDDPDPADHDVDFTKIVSDRERAEWQQAAIVTGWELDEWMKITLNKAARQVLVTAAQIERTAA